MRLSSVRLVGFIALLSITAATSAAAQGKKSPAKTAPAPAASASAEALTEEEKNAVGAALIALENGELNSALHGLHSQPIAPRVNLMPVLMTEGVMTGLIMPCEAADCLPPAFANLQADLENTDIKAELQKAGFRFAAAGDSNAPELVVTVANVGAINPAKRDRKIYLIAAMVSRVVSLPGANNTRIVAGRLIAPPVVSTGDDSKDAQLIRVQVRGLISTFTGWAKQR